MRTIVPPVRFRRGPRGLVAGGASVSSRYHTGTSEPSRKESGARENGRPNVEFLVNIEVGWPADGDPEERARLTAAERVRGAELAKAGVIRRMWRGSGALAEKGGGEGAEEATLLARA